MNKENKKSLAEMFLKLKTKLPKRTTPRKKRTVNGTKKSGIK